MKNIDNIDIEKLKQEKVVVLFTANLEDGKPFYLYIHMTLLKFAEFSRDNKDGKPIDMPSLGDIVERGWGNKPSKEVHERIEREYGEVQS